MLSNSRRFMTSKHCRHCLISHFICLLPDIHKCLDLLKGSNTTEIVATVKLPSSWYNRKKKVTVSRQSLRTLRQRWMAPNSGFCWLNDEVSTVVATVMTVTYFKLKFIQVVNLYSALIARHATSMNTKVN